MSNPMDELMSAIMNGKAKVTDHGSFTIKSNKDEAPARPLDVQARILTDLLPEVQRPNPFQVGDIVQQRRAYTRYKYPGNNLSMVTEVLAQKTRVAGGDGLPCERDDIVILTLVDDDTWVEYAVESWRFEKYEGDIA
jgi:hypothetical protein